MKKPTTVAELEAITGQPDSIRNVGGSNARSDKKISTLEKEMKRLIKNLTLPEGEAMPTKGILYYGNMEDAVLLSQKQLKAVAALLNAMK